jgi:8-oxo-dGTP pyrophosphatase MutT (NUDIX family)
VSEERRGPWIVKRGQTKYENPWIVVCEDEVVRPDGQPGVFATVRMRPGVSVLAVDAENFAYLTAEYRYAVRRESVEVVSGAVDAGEDQLEAARRELREELGIEASEWTDLGPVDPFTSVVDSPARLFLARGLAFAECAPEATELIRSIRVPLAEAVGMVMRGDVTHGPSCVLILKAHVHLGQHA